MISISQRKMRNLVVFLIFLLSIQIQSSLQLDDGTLNVSLTTAEFCYDDPNCGPASSAWSGVCHSGAYQSPIDIPPKTKLPLQGSNTLNFNNLYSSNDFYIVDNGHTVQVTLQPTTTSSAQMSGYGFDYPYTFAQIHFHWGGAEHTLNGFRYPMEAHLVHYDSKYPNFTAAANSGDYKGLAVLAVFLADSTESTVNPAFDAIAQNIPDYNTTPTHVQQPLDLSWFLPKKGQNFYRYYGSLTTPGCTESVEWTVLQTPVYVKASMMQKFRNIQSDENRIIGENHRPTNPLDGRTIQYFTKA